MVPYTSYCVILYCIIFYDITIYIYIYNTDIFSPSFGMGSRLHIRRLRGPRCPEGTKRGPKGPRLRQQ